MSGVTINGTSLLTLLEDEALTAGGSPVLTFLTALGAAQNDPLKVLAAWLQFQGNLAPALITFEVGLAGKLITAIQARVAAAVTAAQAHLAGMQSGPAAPAPAAG